jgi:Lrp/AsnC family transcriptional regulator, leucine-responsive regulatory protein
LLISELDAIDRHILEALQTDGRLSVVDLADRVGLSPSPCLRRLKRLEAEGHVAGYRALLSRERVGLGLTVFVGVKVDGHRDENATALQQAIKAMPEVVSAHLVSGEADFLLEVVVPDLKHYEAFLIGTLLKLPMIKDIRSNFAIRTVKTDATLPLGHLAPPASARKETRKVAKPTRRRS